MKKREEKADEETKGARHGARACYGVACRLW